MKNKNLNTNLLAEQVNDEELPEYGAISAQEAINLQKISQRIIAAQDINGTLTQVTEGAIRVTTMEMGVIRLIHKFFNTQKISTALLLVLCRVKD